MIELVLVFCLIGRPGMACQEYRPPMTELPAEMICGGLAPQLLAVPWLAAHHGWHLASWRCQIRPGRDS